MSSDARARPAHALRDGRAARLGKTTLATELERRHDALRLTKDDWMMPLFGWGEFEDKREVVEALLWRIRFLDVLEEELFRRLAARNRQRDPNDVPITAEQLREYLPRFQRPTEEELAGWRAAR